MSNERIESGGVNGGSCPLRASQGDVVGQCPRSFRRLERHTGRRSPTGRRLSDPSRVTPIGGLDMFWETLRVLFAVPRVEFLRRQSSLHHAVRAVRHPLCNRLARQKVARV